MSEDPYRNDAESRCRALEQELVEVNRQLREVTAKNAKKSGYCPECNRSRESLKIFLHQAFHLLWLVPALIAIGWLGLMVFNGIEADGKVDYCYIDTMETNSSNVHLHGHRSWRENTDLGDFPSVNTAAEAAKAIGCPLK